MSLAKAKDTAMKEQSKGKYETKQKAKQKDELRVAPPQTHSLLFLQMNSTFLFSLTQAK